MRKRIVTIYLFILLAVTLSAQGRFPFQTQQPTDWSGTGWALNKGYIVTNHHVADNARTIRVSFSHADTTVQYSAQVVIMDEENDLALLKINDSKFRGFGTLPYAIKTTLADVGESVFVLGYPLTTTMGEEIKLTTGIISSHSGFQGSKVQYQISAPVQPGNSGGPLFDDNGNIIGVVNAKHSDAENVSYAIKASYLQALVGRLQDKDGVIPTKGNLAGLNLPEKVKNVKDLVCLIHCSSRGETPRSATPKYGSSEITKGAKVVRRPYVDFTRTANTRIVSVTITDNETIVEMTNSNEAAEGFSQWMSIDKNTTITANGQELKLKRAEGIAISPDKTVFTKAGETKTFKLVFPAIAKGTTTFNLVEPGESDWKFYGISLKEY